MDHNAEMTWSRPPDQIDPMAQLNNMDELNNFFEFTDLDLGDLSGVNSAQFGDAQVGAGTHPSTPLEEMNEMQVMSATSAKDFAAHEQHFQQQQAQQQQAQSQQRLYRFNGGAITSHPFTTESMYQPAMQQTYQPPQQPFQFTAQHNYPSTQHVPPTPNSFEMHGEAGRFMQQPQEIPGMDPQQRAILAQRYQLRKEDIAFTPMVSPAGTPSQYAIPDYNTINPGQYFSPLTSPALHAQHNSHYQPHQQQHPVYPYHPGNGGSNVTSPIDLNGDVDMAGEDILLPESAALNSPQQQPQQQQKKPRLKRANTPRTADPLARVRQSPIQKAVKRKSANMLTSAGNFSPTNPQSPRAPSSQPGSAGLAVPPQYRHDNSSESGSISPEPLSEALMGPPPRPTSSVTNSPALNAQQQQQLQQQSQQQNGDPSKTPKNGLGKAATPKSFLSMHHARPTTGRSNDPDAPADDSNFDEEFVDIQLPDAMAAAGSPAISAAGGSRPTLPTLNTQVTSGSDGGADSATPRLTATSRKTPKLGPLSTPASSSARSSSSAVASPVIMGSPMTMAGTTPGALLRKSGAEIASKSAGRNSKKRNSMGGTSSVLVSPALRPKISPSIKPLLPEGSTFLSSCFVAISCMLI